MDFGSNSSSKHMNVAMGAVGFDNSHEPAGNMPGSSSKAQLFSGISKGSNITSSSATPNSAGNNTGSTTGHNLGRLNSLSQANPFRPDAHNIARSNSTAGQAAAVPDDNLTLRQNTSGILNLSSSNNDATNDNNDDDDDTNPNNDVSDTHTLSRYNRGGNAASNNANTSSNGVRYKECLKNHVANRGGYALDGCGEFMPAGEDGSLEALKCAACGCHRNFHRREISGGGSSTANNMSLLALPSPISTSNTSTSCNSVDYGEGDHNHNTNGLVGGTGAGGGLGAAAAGGLIRGHYSAGHVGALLPHLHHHHHPYMHPWPIGSKLMGGATVAGHHPGMHGHHAGSAAGMAAGGGGQYNPYSLNMGGPGHMVGAAGGGGGGGSGGGASGGKRFRTKFTMEQREKMFEFSEKVGWRIQKQDEAAVQQFCAEAGVKRHVLKVWMHNNKNTFGKKLLRFPEAFNTLPESSS